MHIGERLFLDNVDIQYSYHFAKKMEQFRTNKELGYRTAGSRAEFETGEMIRGEMESVGLSAVKKYEISLDGWEFKEAVLRYRDRLGRNHEFQLGAYQTQFVTDGWQEFDLVYLGKGTAADYDGMDVEGKLVLVEINQRDEWWINFPVYQAFLRKAAAIIAVQTGGYGLIHDTALNAQDIAGPAEAAAFSISRTDALVLKADLMKTDRLRVSFSADTRVERDVKSYNIAGEIPGMDREKMILLSAHYDSYFSGFQDDNAAVAMMLSIARTMIASGYKPQKTLVFCAFAAEEWGVVNSKYDWSTGAYEQVFRACPQWQGNVVADLNFELPAHAHQKRDGIRCVYEYADFLEDFAKTVKVPEGIYPEGFEVLCPVQTWSDDFSMAIAGIPSMVNDFSGGPYMETHYHTQFDSEEFYDPDVYQFHHELYGRLAIAFDQTAIAPLNFERLFQAMEERVNLKFSSSVGAREGELLQLLKKARKEGKRVYSHVQTVNSLCRKLVAEGEGEKAYLLTLLHRKTEETLLFAFRKAQDSFVRLNWHDDVLFPQEAVRFNLKRLRRAISCLESGNVRGALDAVYEIDNNRYAFLFDEAVFTYFTEYVLDQPKERLKWGAGRIVHHENLFSLVESLRKKMKEEDADTEWEYELIKEVEKNQHLCYCDDIEYMIREIRNIMNTLKTIKKDEDHGL